MYKSILIKYVKCQIFGIWHIKHQNMSLMKCFKCQKFWHTTAISSQIWDDTDNNCKNLYYYFIYFFSLLITNISLSSSSLSSLSSLFLFHSTPITKGHHLTPPISQKLPLDTTDHLSSLFCFGFFFFSFLFTFFGCGLMCGLGNGWVWMGRLVVGGFGWADCCPPRSTVHLTLSDRRSLMLIFVFFVIFVFLWLWFWCSAVVVLVWDGGVVGCGVLMGGLVVAVGGCVGYDWVVFFVVVFVFLWRWFWCSAVGVLVWDGGGWGVDGCWQRGWAVGCGGGGWFFLFSFIYFYILVFLMLF